MTLLFLRHGIRGTQFSNSLNSDQNLTFISTNKDLSKDGFDMSFKVGKYINDNFGKPDFIYADISDTRTVNTGLALARGSKVDKVWVHKSSEKLCKDDYFKNDPILSKESLDASSERLKTITSQLLSIRDKVLEIIPTLNLPSESKLSKKGTCKGLLKDLAELYNHVIFTKLSGLIIGNNIKEEQNTTLYNSLITSKSLLWSVEYPTYDSIEYTANTLLSGIVHFLNKYNLSVLIGHDTNISIISQYLNKVYNVGYPDQSLMTGYPELSLMTGYGKQYVPPNSGFIFKIKPCGCITIKYIYLSFDGTWSTSKFLTVESKNLTIKDSTSFNLISLLTGI